MVRQTHCASGGEGKAYLKIVKATSSTRADVTLQAGEIVGVIEEDSPNNSYLGYSLRGEYTRLSSDSVAVVRAASATRCLGK